MVQKARTGVSDENQRFTARLYGSAQSVIAINSGSNKSQEDTANSAAFICETYAIIAVHSRLSAPACRLPLRGNARELRSLIERTMLIAPQGATITREAVETLVVRQTKTAGLADAWAACSLDEEVQLYERSLIQMALKASHGHVTEASRLLGITHQRLSSILQGRHKDLHAVRTPVKRRRRSVIKR